MPKVPVYVAFDYDHDEGLKTLLVGQAANPDAPFQISDWSIKTASANWKAEARTRIRRVSQVIVLCGEHTDSATGVSEELKIAREEGVPYFLLAGHSNAANRRPSAASATDKLYKWTWPNLKALIAGDR